MNRNYLLAAFLLLSAALSAQKKESNTSIFFETDQSTLSAEDRQTLDNLAPILLQAPDYQVDIEAFTDDRGTQAYNLQLAAARAASVQQYLAEKGLLTDKTSVQNWGEKKAAGSSDEGRQKSRRVDVAVQSFFFDDLESLRERLSANTVQTLKISSNEAQTVTAARGTQIQVPANAFVFEDGTTPTGPLEIHIQEAYDPSDFILHNLTTTSNGQILQTGGMVNITATSGGRELQLAEGAALTVAIPNGGNFDPEMQLFYGQHTAEAGVDWVPTEQSFRKTWTSFTLEIDPSLGARIAALKVPAYPKPELTAYKGKMAPEPKAPTAPYRPHAPKKPVWSEVEKLFSGGDAERLNRKKLKKAEQYFQTELAQFERDSVKYIDLAARYERNLAGYQKANQRFQEQHKAWVKELEARLTAIQIYKRELRGYAFSKNLEIVLKQKAKHIQKYPVYSQLQRVVEEAVNRRILLSAGKPLGNGRLTEVAIPQLEKGTYDQIIGNHVMDQYKGFGALQQLVASKLSRDTMDRVTNRILKDCGLKQISDSLRAELAEKEFFANQNAPKTTVVASNYIASVAQLGWINCDRFYNNPAQRMEVSIQESEEASFYAICSDINAMLSMVERNGYYVVNGLPKGQKITVVAIKLENGMAKYARKDMKVGDTPGAPMQFRSLPLRDLKAELKKLNG